MSLLQKLTEGIRKIDKQKETQVLVDKWEEMGLLEGLESERARSNMAILLENQAAELLKEASTMSGGDVEGFASVAFPLVRRSFGGLVANDLVSVQPMSLPSGLIFFLDFTRDRARLGDSSGDSVYGGGVTGQQVTGGVSLVGANIEKGFHNLANGYSSPTGSAAVSYTAVASGTTGEQAGSVLNGTAAYTALNDRLVRYDADLGSGTVFLAFTAAKSSFTDLDEKDYVSIVPTMNLGRVARRLTVTDPTDSTKLLFVVYATGTESPQMLNSNNVFGGTITTNYVQRDARTSGLGRGSIVGTTPWGLENNPNIPEIDILVNSIHIEAETKKLKATWTPELQQDLQSFQSVDAEVELTSILSEHIALELDQMILEDLIKGATAGTYYWSRRPGRYVNRSTGAAISTSANESLLGADFTGNQSEWYETLIETINDVSAQILRKIKRGGANFLVVSPEVANILEATNGFRGSVTHDQDRGEAGTLNVGKINKKWDVYVDSYFPRNVVLVGRKGNGFLESGYCFAPYVPLQSTPTIYDPNSGVPRKILMTRFGRTMVMADHYGLVVVQDMLG